ncbi:hypothetical protein OG921_04485 [Aldersonia sp. NBC_00410]|uniref:hypothetical protein n=1 Tax=Aldersonia sp. NBC_00410 TaxID=2975954 RepID=UPI0022511D75|nr:hypothetical protein [Aldersonia sp. NBC_00410]MCX5042433.1 hypothetical protein [Aldersonia sp. NBC_00410]
MSAAVDPVSQNAVTTLVAGLLTGAGFGPTQPTGPTAPSVVSELLVAGYRQPNTSSSPTASQTAEIQSSEPSLSSEFAMSANAIATDSSSLTELPDGGQQVEPALVAVSANNALAVQPPGFQIRDEAVIYTNLTDHEVRVIYQFDDLPEQETTAQPGETITLSSCASASTVCNYGAVSRDAQGRETVDAITTIRKDGEIAPGPNSQYTQVSGTGYYSSGFAEDGADVVYTNNTGETVTVLYYTTGIEDRQVTTAQPGRSVRLPGCSESTGECIYEAGSGDPEDPDWQPISTTRINNSGTEFYEVGGYGPTLARDENGVAYTNTTDRNTMVAFEDANGNRVYVTVPPGQSVVLPPCDGVGNTCRYIAIVPNIDGETADSLILVAVETDEPDVPEQPGVPPSAPHAQAPKTTRIPQLVRPAPYNSMQSSRGSTGANQLVSASTLGDDGWRVSPAQINFCNQMGGSAGYACAGYELGNAIGRGDVGAILSANMGLLGDTLKAKYPGGVGYGVGVALNVWSYTVGEATHTDFSSKTMGETIAYGAANPQVVVQESIKAVGVVATNIWSAFVPW